MKRLYKWLRALLMVLVTLAVVVPTLIYVALSLPAVQDDMRRDSEEILSDLLGADVTIGDLYFRPLNRATLRDVAVTLEGDTVMKVGRLGAGINLSELILRGRVTLTYAEVIDLDLRVSRDSADAPLNVQPILDALAGDNADKEPAKINMRVNTVVVRRAALSYDVNDAPAAANRFDPRHIRISELQADVNLPRLRNDCYIVNLKRLSFAEQSGFAVKDLSCEARVDEAGLSWSNLELQLPSTSLLIADGAVAADSISDIGRAFADDGIGVGIKRGSYLYFPDFKAFVPQLADFDIKADVKASAHLSAHGLGVEYLDFVDPQGQLSLNVTGAAVENYGDLPRLTYEVDDLTLSLGGGALSRLDRMYGSNGRRMALPGTLRVKAKASGDMLEGRIDGDADIDRGSLSVKAHYARRSLETPMRVAAGVKARNLDLSNVKGFSDIGTLNADLDADATLARGHIDGQASLSLTDFLYRRSLYDRIAARITYVDGVFDGSVELDDDSGNVDITFSGDNRLSTRRFTASARLEDVDLYEMNLINDYEGYTLSGVIETDVEGSRLNDLTGYFDARKLMFSGVDGNRLAIDSLVVNSRHDDDGIMVLTLASDHIKGSIEGAYDFETLPAEVNRIFCGAFPLLSPAPEVKPGVKRPAEPIAVPRCDNDFTFRFEIDQTEEPAEFFKLPVSVIYPATISGRVDCSEERAALTFDAPYLRQGTQLVENARLDLTLDGQERRDRLTLAMTRPSKQGKMTIKADLTGAENAVDARLSWDTENQKRYDGNVEVFALLRRGESGIGADIDVRQSHFTASDSVWTVHPARVIVDSPKDITVDDINVSRANQFVKIDGRVTPETADTLTVDVLNLSLDYIFDMLAIDAVQLGGDASGRLTGAALLSSTPRLETEGINVKNISYNRCVLGDAVIKSNYDTEAKAVNLDADIVGDDGRHSTIVGSIYPVSSELDIMLTPNNVPLGFMEYFMGAFSSDISGRGTGEARLFGTFKDVDMVGKLAVDDLRLKINFTNTYFHATDTIYLNPGQIVLDDITLKDYMGNTARLNGTVSHDYFHDPVFDIAITDARRMLVYDESSKDNPDWYGRVFVNGGATIKGAPGIVEIDVEASSAPGSVFTFVLSDMEEADEYTFLTFRDKSKLDEVVETGQVDLSMGLVNRLRAMNDAEEADEDTEYVIELKVDITPDAEIILVMDPVAGDRIKSHGSGNLRMVYESKDNDLKMFGTYTLERGTYNFTLQDIIIKEFTINEGSSIMFTGDPLAAKLNIEAVYQLNANLSDLDESFLLDKDLNRTNVPVQALLRVKGDIQEPEISFDLAFPSLTSDVYRKVKSIVSTDEMMNRQIIYLLALNRFYTPDYMGSTTKGNELFSVASSTLTSQLSNMLSHLSDKWSISPNLRSDRGDFSDVEVDVALSSRLLNNRLLLNGNFGYRDKSLNSNQFIGDFEIEYLLNRAGTLRLKAYSYYNDENYYVRTAATTQGVGVMVKRDFDNALSFLDFLRRRKSTPADTVAPASVAPADTVAPATAPADAIPSGTVAPAPAASTPTEAPGL